MFEQPSSTTNTATSSGSGSETNHYFELGARTPANQSHPTSVIVPPRQQHHHQHHHPQSDSSPLTPCTPYYPTNGYGFPLFLGTDFLQFPPTDVTSPLTPNISSPLTPHPFGPIPAIPTNQIYSRPAFPDFYTAASTTPMVQYSTGKKSSAGRKPKEEDNMDDDDDDKRLKRRQRNKEAAARCRQRRIDLMKELQEQVNGFKHLNDKKSAEVNEIRNKLNSLKNYLETHDCKLTPDERMNQLRLMTIPPPSAPPPQHHQLQHQLRVHPPRADSVPYSIKSSHSSSSSEQHSPIEDYKPSIDQLLLPPISCIQNTKDRLINSMPPPALPASTSAAGMQIITSIPVPHSSSISINRSENIFAEPELKIPKIEMDRTLASLAEDVERPSALPMLSRTPANHPITTPGRIFRFNGDFQTPGQNGQGGLFIGGDAGRDFLASNTGLTPSGQPTMNFVSTPTPIQPLPDADLRPL
uniref:BZIP domain-containing protein n=1 Tax=Caenorhabditis tropicalis TaxID=1561998 RepID=A0A1I7T3K2_9PELO